MATTLYDSDNSGGADNISYTYHQGISTTQYQWALALPNVEFLEYVAFWKDE